MNKRLWLLATALVLTACAVNAPKPYGTPFPINPPTSAGISK